MRKTLNTILIVIVGLLTLIACTPQTSLTDELVSATLVTSDRTRALIADVNFDIAEVDVWKYTAKKADNGLTTGATTEQTPLSEAGETEGLSQGSWNFNLYGYKVETVKGEGDSSKEIEKLICSGYVDNANVTHDDHTITITVKPSQTTNGTGNIVIDEGIEIADSDGTPYETSRGSDYQYTKTIAVYKSGSNTALESYEEPVSSGVYKVVVTYTATTNTGKTYTAATGEKTFNVYDNLTTTVSGTVKESVQAAKITGEGVFSADVTGTIPESGNTLELEVDATPLGNSVKLSETETMKTAVVFPANSLTATSDGSNEVKLSVTTTSIETASSTYSVADNGSTVAAFDLTLSGATIAEENDGIEITTYVVPGLDKSKLAVKYVEDETDNTATITDYDPDTGLLKFTVKHFSEYILTTEENLVYDTTTLVSALLEGRNVKLAQDIVLNYDEVKRLTNTSGPVTININKTVDVDFNGRSLYPNNIKIQIWDKGNKNPSHNVTFKNGKIDGTNNCYDVSVLNGKLVLDTMTLSAPEGDRAAVSVGGPNNSPSLEIKNSTISVKGIPAVLLSNSSYYDTNHRIVTITNSTLCGSVGFDIKSWGDNNDVVTISGCTINGEYCGAYINGGNYTIKDTTISVTDAENGECALYLDSNYATEKTTEKNKTWYYTPTSVTLEKVTLKVADSEKQKAIIATVNDKYSAGCKITLDGTLSSDSAESISYRTYTGMFSDTYNEINAESMTEDQKGLFTISWTKATE